LILPVLRKRGKRLCGYRENQIHINGFKSEEGIKEKPPSVGGFFPLFLVECHWPPKRSFLTEIVRTGGLAAPEYDVVFESFAQNLVARPTVSYCFYAVACASLAILLIAIAMPFLFPFIFHHLRKPREANSPVYGSFDPMKF
jgi:hypothetical protein